MFLGLNFVTPSSVCGVLPVPGSGTPCDENDLLFARCDEHDEPACKLAVRSAAEQYEAADRRYKNTAVPWTTHSALGVRKSSRTSCVVWECSAITHFGLRTSGITLGGREVEDAFR